MNVFISYSHQNKQWLQALSPHLKSHQHLGELVVWSDDQLQPGVDWLTEIETALLRARVAVFLVSDQFLSSSFIMGKELPVLLDRAEHENVRILWLSVEPHISQHPLTRYQALGDPNTPLSSLKPAPRKAAMVRIAQQIADAAGAEGSASSSDGMDSSQSIHIFTSVKGGVGKTLTALAVVGSYIDRNLGSGNGKVLAVDLNTMNIDLYNMLKDQDPRNEGQLQDLPWRCSMIDQTTDSYVVRRNIPYMLPLGAVSFWEGLRELSDALPSHDLVIDTNLHIANLVLGPKEARPDPVIHRILSSNHRKIYIWIIWTFAALKNSEFIEKGIRSFKAHFGTSIPDIEERVKFVHVLNPSALIAPQNELSEELELIVATRQRFDDLIHHLHGVFPNDPDEELIIELKKKVLQQILEQSDFFSSDDSNNVDAQAPTYYFPGLKALMENEKSILDEIDLDGLIERIGQFIVGYADQHRLSSILSAIYEQNFKDKGRPQNLLPIYVYDSHLHGYTENDRFYTGGNIDSLRSHLGEVQRIMDHFLKFLLKRTTRKKQD